MYTSDELVALLVTEGHGRDDVLVLIDQLIDLDGHRLHDHETLAVLRAQLGERVAVEA